MDSIIRTRILKAVRAVEAVFDRAFGSRDNPLRHLGALGFYFFWVMAVSGVYLYAFYDTGVAEAYGSVARLTHDQWYLGGVMRSLHRYAADAFVAVVGLHLAKEAVNARYRGFRWFSWMSGVPTLWLALASGIGGYWLVWDQVAQFSATATAEWLDWLPLFGEPLARNFLTPAAVSDRFFSLLSFLHIGIPLLLLLAMWVHVQRVSLADVAPPRRLGWGTLAALAALSLARPAMSSAAANVATEPAQIAIDWFYLFMHPLLYQTSPAFVWTLAFGATFLLAAAPLLRGPKPAPVARVSPPDCNGCGRCVADCPYAAVRLIPHTLRGTYRMQASVDPALCASCGICAGACPSSTPFRTAGSLVSGIDMPRLSIDALRRQLNAGLTQLSGVARTVVVGCDCAADVGKVAGAGVVTLRLPCIGNLPPAFIEYALRRGRQGAGADGVLISGCREGDCAYRFGNEWTRQRLAGEREPHLRAHVPNERVCVAWANGGEEARLADELAAFRGRLAHAAVDR
ncbi:MAG TPA: hydrogenase iron-sulfur subunit [Burkholderiales bacterium]|nr:hydrogenase iron-sulfur subunit [Burkholderiales bacterium]